jgi:hypothetical protein
MKTTHLCEFAFVAIGLCGLPARSQTPGSMEAIGQRLERLERQNAELLDEIRLLRREMQALQPPAPSPSAAAGSPVEPQTPSETERIASLEEKVELQEGRLNEVDAVKVESSQKVPVRLTGMALFNAFTNSRHGGTADNPTTASLFSGPVNAAGTLRQSVIGLEFNGPEAIAGAKVRGSFLMDLFGGTSGVLGNQVRLRTAEIEAQWDTRTLMAGQEKPIFSPREPNSLAQVGVSPLTSAGNLWLWRPQVRFDQRFSLDSATDVSARVGLFETAESGGGYDERQVNDSQAQQLLGTLEQRRPALEGRFQLTHRFSDTRRVEVAPGFHFSTTHIGGVSVPSNAVSVDWFFNPLRRLEFTGFMFMGKDLSGLGGGGVRQGFTIINAQPQRVQIIPVRSRGGWAQLTFIAAPRLSFNLYGGEDDPNNRDLPSSGIGRNLAFAGNVFFKLAPNVVIGGEVSQVRTQLLTGQQPHSNHYDLALAYLF